MTRKIQSKSVVLEGGCGFFWKLWGNYHKNSIIAPTCRLVDLLTR